MTTRKRGTPRPTWTHLVSESLRSADDFCSMKQLIAETGGTPNQISAALHHLQKCRVVDAVSGPDGLFWFYRGDDLRTRELAERVPEENKRRVRRPRIVKVKTKGESK